MNRRSFLRTVGAMLSVPFLAAAGCAAERAGGSSKAGGPPEDGPIPEGQTMDFNAVVLGDHSQNPCTPEIADEFLGIRINAPERVVANQDSFAICGTYRFPADYIYGFADVHDAIVLVAVDAERHTPFACNFAEPVGAIPGEGPPPGPEDPAWMKNHRIRKYFNVDLLSYMETLPMRPATYWVYALIEGHVSNVCKVRFEV